MVCTVLFVSLVNDLRTSALPGSLDLSHSMFDLRSPPHRFMKVSTSCTLRVTSVLLKSQHIWCICFCCMVFSEETLKGTVLCTGRAKGRSSIPWLTLSVYFPDASSSYCCCSPTKLLRNLSRLLVRTGEESMVPDFVISPITWKVEH